MHGPLGATIKQMRRYVQSHARPSAYRDGRNPFIDGVAQVWFDDTNAMRESAKTTEYAAVRADEPNFIDVSRLSFIITQERFIIAAQRSCASAQCSPVQLYSCARRPGETASCMTPSSPRSAGTPLPPTRLAHRRPIAGDVSMP